MPTQEKTPNHTKLWLLLAVCLGAALGAISMAQCDRVAVSPSTPEHETVTHFVQDYFKLWNEATIDQYEALFADIAVIQYLGPDQPAYSLSKSDFIKEQRAHLRENPGTSEVPKKIAVLLESPESAQAFATWDLLTPRGTQHGVDLFTLIRQNNAWKIVHLAFYTTSN